MQSLHSKHRQSAPPAARHIGKLALCGLGLLLASQAAMANNWQICRMRVEITGVLKQQDQLQARVLQVTPHPRDAECPAIDSTLAFRPEQPDYQNDLPRKAWPKIGQTIRMRYQYLDGICKERGPCRIKHYPIDPP